MKIAVSSLYLAVLCAFLPLNVLFTSLNAAAMPTKESLSPLISKPLTGIDLRDVTSAQKTLDTNAAKATVIVFLSAKCPCSNSHEPTLKALAGKYQNQGFRFLAIHSNLDEDLAFSTRHFSETPLPFPVLQDTNSHWANTLGAFKTPHAYLISPQGEILFQGGIDDCHLAQEAKKHFLADAIEAVHQGKQPLVKQARALGCVIARKP